MKIRCHKSGFQRIKRIISIFIAYTLVFPYMTWAFETPDLSGDARPVCINGLPIQIPAELGRIVKSFRGNEKLVIHIQDLHCNYEVQHNIAGIIDLLAGKHGVKLVGIEGAGLPINVTKLSTFPMEEVKREVGDYYVKLGKISGPEFYAATGRHPVYLEGVETAGHYAANRKCVNEFLNNESQGYVCDLRYGLEEIKTRICDSRLLKFDARESDELLRRLDIIEKLLSISASPEEIAEYRTYPERFRIGSFVKFICRHEISDISDLVREAYALEHYLAMAGDFYKMADQRSLDFVENLMKRMEKKDTEQAILVTGGYHTEVILKQLRQQRIGYVSVKPRLRQLNSANPYFLLLMNRQTPLEKLMARNRQAMALSPFFMPFEDTKAVLTGNEPFMPEFMRLDYRILGAVLKMIGFKELDEDASLFPLEKESWFAAVCSEAMRKKIENRPLWVLPLNGGDELVFYRKKIMSKVAKTLKAVGINGGEIKKNYIGKISKYPANIRGNELDLDAVLKNPDGSHARINSAPHRHAWMPMLFGIILLCCNVGGKDVVELDRIEEQAKRIVEGDIKGLVLDERREVVGDEKYLKRLRLRLGEIFVGECKKKFEAGKELYEFWELAERDEVFLVKVGEKILLNRIRIRGIGTMSLDSLIGWACTGIKRYSKEKGLPVEQNRIKDGAKDIILGALGPLQFSGSERLLRRDLYMEKEMERRGNEGVVMVIGIAGGISMCWYTDGKMLSHEQKEALPGIAFIKLADRFKGKRIKLFGVDIEMAGLEDLIRQMREGKTDEELKTRYLSTQIEYLCCDVADELRVENGSVDIVSVANVFPYIAQDTLKLNALLNIWQALKNGGLLVFVDSDLEDMKVRKDAQGNLIHVMPGKSIYEVYRKDGAGLAYAGRLSRVRNGKVELNKGDEEPLLDKYLKMLQASLAKKADGSTAEPHLVVLGMTHKTTDQKTRENFTFRKEELPRYLNLLKEKAGVKEVMILSTCNRTEIYVVTDKRKETEQMLFDFMSGFYPDETDKHALKNQIFIKSDQAVLSHLFLVVSGLDAIAVGEAQITGQVRAAYKEACEGNTTGRILEQVYARAKQVNRIIRKEFPEISHGDISTSALAVKKAKKLMGDLTDKHCVLVGAGEVGHVTWEELQKQGVTKISVVTRTRKSAENLAEHIREDHTTCSRSADIQIYSELDSENFGELLQKADILLTATSAPHKPIICRDAIENVMRQRPGDKPLFIFDISFPGDVEDTVNGVNGVYYYNIEHLKDMVENHRQVVVQGGRIIAQEAGQEWQRLLKGKAPSPEAAVLKQVNTVWKAWQEFYLNEFDFSSPAARAYLEKTLQTLTNKCLHPLRKGLKKNRDLPGADVMEALAVLWRLEDVGRDFTKYQISDAVLLKLQEDWNGEFVKELAKHKSIDSFVSGEREYIQKAGNEYIHSLLSCADMALGRLDIPEQAHAQERLAALVGQGKETRDQTGREKVPVLLCGAGFGVVVLPLMFLAGPMAAWAKGVMEKALNFMGLLLRIQRNPINKKRRRIHRNVCQAA